MNNLITKNYLGNNIEFKLVNGQVYANATSMCKAFGKLPKDWLKTEQTQEYISELERKEKSPNGLVEIVQGGRASEQGTWIHEKLILDLARWLNVKFRVWCDEQIAILLREGNVNIKKVTDIQNKRLEIMEMNAKTRAAKQLTKLAEMAQTEKMKEIAISLGVNLIVGKNAIPLPVAEIQEKTYSAGEIGDQLGVSSNRIGKIANMNNLKTNEFGEWVHDKSKYSNKEVRTFRYFEKAINEFKKYL
ncbi:KilA-N domain-containing protein [Fusobacterium ulcerans]|uniref:KilA-N domain-containing protein n=1 Tax=Fusobacterium ulcerans TaxID=861 RepID=UPI0026EFB86D|nr:KilA-N domain-containing protein [Fusobacterium ulcerans]